MCALGQTTAQGIMDPTEGGVGGWGGEGVWGGGGISLCIAFLPVRLCTSHQPFSAP